MIQLVVVESGLSEYTCICTCKCGNVLSVTIAITLNKRGNSADSLARAVDREIWAEVSRVSEQN